MSLIWSQTALKDLEKEETCPFRWKSQWMDKSFRSPTNEDMERGKYFEQLLLGQSANEKEKISDLPRLDSGTKSADQIRIEAQAERGKRILSNPNDPEYLGFGVVSTQLALKIEDEGGTIDIEATDGTNTWIIDVKLTKDLTNTRTIYGWGNDLATMDLMQLAHYQRLYELSFEKKVRVGFLIFDYSPSKRIKFAEVVVSEKKIIERNDRFKAAKDVVAIYKDRGWTKFPSLKECDRCPLSCDKRLYQSKLVKEIVNY